jgi:hypothetical protein
MDYLCAPSVIFCLTSEHDDLIQAAPMTPDQEFGFYAQPENQEPQGPARRRHASRLGTPVPVRFPPELLEQARCAADADDRSLSAWIRRAVEHELRRTA